MESGLAAFSYRFPDRFPGAPKFSLGRKTRMETRVFGVRNGNGISWFMINPALHRNPQAVNVQRLIPIDKPPDNHRPIGEFEPGQVKHDLIPPFHLERFFKKHGATRVVILTTPLEIARA